ncbi:MAG: M28 family peptidase, partial [Bacteroidales bacterium]
GAAAVIFVNTPTSKNYHPIGSVMDGRGEHFLNIPAIEIDHQTAELFFDGSGFSFADIYNTIIEQKAPHSIELKSKAIIDIKAIYNSAVDVYNIIGYIEGKNVSKKDEYILLTAHLDHVGSQCEVVFPGANDNASGSAAILELARYFSEYKPEHSIIFALLTAEESGLQGAEFLAANLPVSSDKIIAALNFDCIASGDSIQLGNGLTNPELFKLAKSLDKNNLVIKDTWSNGGADLTPFVKSGIPGLYFVTKYSYTNLHLQTDTFENCNLDLFEKVVILAAELIKNIDKGKYERENILKTETE